MRILLDSHALLWALIAPDKLSAAAAREIRSAANNVWFSPASVWELEIKRAQGKLELPDNWLEAVERARFVELPIRGSHGMLAGRLPWHHRDPFDRMLIAQALVEDLRLATRDRLAASYGVKVLEA
ncbi:MAG: type II toxin-antitoxin system VapC family toxin [Chthoniobacterales bacterium]|nr:type II toxin-antitoxin system VapC family toxin [Chthoniobacterales bacterium]